MVSIATQASYLPARMINDQGDDTDFSLFQDQQMFSGDMFGLNNLQNFDGMEVNMAAYNFARPAQEQYPQLSEYPSASQMFTDASRPFTNKQSPHPYPLESPELRPPPSNLSTASGPSASSSAMGSPYSTHGQVAPAIPEWNTQGFGLAPTIAGDFSFTQDYNFVTSGMEHDLNFPDFKPHGFVDPSILNSYSGAPLTNTLPTEQDTPSFQPHPVFNSHSPAPSHLSSHSSRRVKTGSQSPFLTNTYQTYPYPPPRRPSLVSRQSFDSQESSFDGDETREKGRCPNPDCGKVFKDLKAHMLTHQNERPEKCPIQTCDYHIKGFARKYDKNRHTLTHYKGTMVCGFCPGSGSAAEKSFNRADVFKRHLTSVHGVEQTPPNSRKKTSGGVNAGKKLAAYAPDATGKCSTCSATFSNAQDFYEHLDDCVLRIVQQEEPSEAINAQRLAEVQDDPAVIETLRANALPLTTSNSFSTDEDDDEEDAEGGDDDEYAGAKRMKTSRSGSNGQKRGLTHSKGGVALHAKVGRKKRKDYPTSWGCPVSQMKMKKRVMCAFDGTRRLWKDDMMLSTDYEVRLPLSDGKAYVTDLDVQTIKRAEAFHNATDEEKGPYVSDDLTGVNLEELMEIKPEQA